MSPQRKSKPSLPTIHWSLVLPLLAVSCGNFPPLGPPPDGNTEPDLAAITTVVKDVYRSEGQRRIIFLGTDEPEAFGANTLAQARSQLEDDLGVTVRPESEADRTDLSLPALTPVLPETGEMGISISLARFRLDEAGNLRVQVTFARSGLDGAVLEYVLTLGEQGWTIIDRIGLGVA